MRYYIIGIVVAALLLVILAGRMLSSSDAAGSMREGQSIGMADAGIYSNETCNEVSDWLSELD